MCVFWTLVNVLDILCIRTLVCVGPELSWIHLRIHCCHGLDLYECVRADIFMIVRSRMRLFKPRMQGNGVIGVHRCTPKKSNYVREVMRREHDGTK